MKATDADDPNRYETQYRSESAEYVERRKTRSRSQRSDDGVVPRRRESDWHSEPEEAPKPVKKKPSANVKKSVPKQQAAQAPESEPLKETEPLPLKETKLSAPDVGNDDPFEGYDEDFDNEATAQGATTGASHFRSRRKRR